MNCCSESNMVLGLASRVFLICLLFSTGCAFPVPDYRYPYPGGGPFSELNLQFAGFPSPSVPLQYEEAPEQGDFSPRNQSPGSLVASLSAPHFAPIYKPKKPVVLYDSNSESSSPEVQSPSAWHTALGALRKPPSSSVHPWSASRTSGHSHVVLGSSPVYEDLFSPAGFGYTTSTDGNSASYGSAAGGSASYRGSSFNPGFVWDEQVVGRPSALFYLGGWMPHHLQDATTWNTDEVPLSTAELPYLPPASYIVQSRNGYQRASEVLSRTKYFDDTFKQLLPGTDIRTPSESPEVTESEGSKGELIEFQPGRSHFQV